jgi:NADPH:quinone reductase-like Zn-dependent oxidoreductase
MRALVVHQFGDPRLLKIEEVPTPAPGDGEALVQIKAAGINPSDVKNIQGKMHGTTLPRIPGRDFAGIVVRGPADLIGKEVWGTGGDVGFTRDGSHAQFILLPRAALTAKPANLSMDAAGSAGLVFVTAFSALIAAANVGPRDTVLIVGAGGGVGSAAVQIAKSRGAKVIGAVRSDPESASARQNGADQVIDTTSANLSDAIGSFTQGRGADVAFDTSGQMFAQCVDAAAMEGRIAVITAPADGTATFNLRNIYRKELRVRGVDTRRLDVVACAKLLQEMKSDFENGKFRYQPGEARPLDQAAEAYADMERGKGRVFLQPN